MRRLEIDASLSLKIIQNEYKLKELFSNTIKRNRNNSEEYKYYYTENSSENEKLRLTENEKVKPFNGNKNVSLEMSSQKTMEIENRNSKNKIKVNKHQYSKSLFITRDDKKNETPKYDISINPFVNKIKNNPINSFHENNNSIRTPLNRYTTSIKYTNIEKMMNRFRESEEKKNQWLVRERTKKELEVKKYYLESPKINTRSKKLSSKIKDNFLIRLQKSEYEKQQKAEILKEFMKKTKMEEEKMHRGMKGKSRTKKTNFIVDKKLYETINKFYLLDEKRKEQIELIQKIKSEKENKFDFVPKINKKSASMAELKRKNYSTKNIFERLAKIGKTSTEKKKSKKKKF